jgi:hypothetical protein
MIIHTKCKTQRAAIRAARQLAIESAADNATYWTERVLLACGDTLHVTADNAGKVTTRTTSGWDRDGHLHCGPKVYSVAN